MGLVQRSHSEAVSGLHASTVDHTANFLQTAVQMHQSQFLHVEILQYCVYVSKGKSKLLRMNINNK